MYHAILMTSILNSELNLDSSEWLLICWIRLNWRMWGVKAIFLYHRTINAWAFSKFISTQRKTLLFPRIEMIWLSMLTNPRAKRGNIFISRFSNVSSLFSVAPVWMNRSSVNDHHDEIDLNKKIMKDYKNTLVYPNVLTIQVSF